MGFVRIPQMLSPEIIKALAGNVYTVKCEQPGLNEEITASWKEYVKSDNKNKCDKKKERECVPQKGTNDIDICCQKKVKFIFALNNAVIINVNAAAAENN